MHSATFVFALAAVASVLATPAPLEKRAVCVPPTASSTKSLSAPQTIAKGASFDGKNVRYDRGSGACTDQAEGGDADAVFLIQEGGTLSNVIIGKNQAEGVHCLGACTLNNVWFEDVCEDAITIKGSGTSRIIGGGALHASDKIVQHNGGGTVEITNFCAEDYGKLYRSCGNCTSGMQKRAVIIKGLKTGAGKLLAGINSNYGDTATIDSASVSAAKSAGVKSICDTFKGNDSGDEPSKLTTNTANSYCKF